MDEITWLTCRDPLRMLRWLGVPADSRRGRLFSVACCRRHWQLLPTEGRRLIEQIERLADEAGEEPDGNDVEGAFHHARSQAVEADRNAIDAALLMVCAAWEAEDVRIEPEQRPEAARQVELIQDIFGNPFRMPIRFPCDWRTPTAVALADGIYADRAFDRLPVLADALEEAGCDDADILAHCRGPGPHVRGCWVVDLVLGQS